MSTDTDGQARPPRGAEHPGSQAADETGSILRIREVGAQCHERGW